MKLRMIALLCVAALLCGCGAQEAAPVTPETAAPTEAVTEAPTEPTTEPTTVPTEPPTAVELLGYSLWEGAQEVAQLHTWSRETAEVQVSRGVRGRYENMPMQFAIVGSNGKEYREAVPSEVTAELYELIGERMGQAMDCLMPFYEKDSGGLEQGQWLEANLDKKLIAVKISQEILGTELYLRTIEEGIKMKDLRIGYTLPDIVDAETCDIMSVTEKYDAWNPTVGTWTLTREDGEITVQAWYTEDFQWDVEEGSKANIAIEHMLYLLVPADYEDLNICMGEYTTDAVVDRLVIRGETKDKWVRGNIQNEDFTACTDYAFRFMGFKIPG